MIIPIPVGMEYTSTVSGAVAKKVKCEECNHVYAYLVERQASASETSALFLENEKAARTAKVKAKTELRKELAYARDLVPCPKCGWVQYSMVDLAKEQRYGRWKSVGVLLLGTILLLGSLGACLNGIVEPNPWIPWSWFVGLLTVVIMGGTILVTRMWLQYRSYDPNGADDIEAWKQLGRSRALTPEQFADVREKRHLSPEQLAEEIQQRPREELPTELVTVLTPEYALRERVADTQAFRGFVKTVTETVQNFFETPTPRTGFTLQVSCAFFPDGKLLLEMQTRPPGQAGDLLAGLRLRLEELSWPAAKEGPVAFAVSQQIWGGTPNGNNSCARPFGTILPAGWNPPLDDALRWAVSQ